MLVGYSVDNVKSVTGRAYIESWADFSDFEVYYIPAIRDDKIEIDFNDFDIVFNNYCLRHCFDDYVSKSWSQKLKEYRGLKVLSIQDEYDFVNKTKQKIEELGFDIVLTSLPDAVLPKVYGQNLLNKAKFVYCHTGFVPDNFPNDIEIIPVSERKIFLGYRGRRIGARYGRLGYLKEQIGVEFKRACNEIRLNCDIEVDEEFRLNSNEWLEFLANCRAVLGSESGSEVFDFDGEVKRKYDEYIHTNRVEPSYEEFKSVIEKYGIKVQIGEISPRIFEAAFLKTPLVLIGGNYSGLIVANEDYIPVKDDFSNINEVFDKLKDTNYLEKIANNVHKKLIGSGNFTYKANILRLQSIFTEKLLDEKYNRKNHGPLFDTEVFTKKPLEYSRYEVLKLASQINIFKSRNYKIVNIKLLIENRKRALKRIARILQKKEALDYSKYLADLSFIETEFLRAYDWYNRQMKLISFQKMEKQIIKDAVFSANIQSHDIVESAFLKVLENYKYHINQCASWGLLEKFEIFRDVESSGSNLAAIFKLTNTLYKRLKFVN